MTIRTVEWDVGETGVEVLDESGLYGLDATNEPDSELEDGDNCVWPGGDLLQNASPPAPGRCRRVPHDW